MTVPRINLTRDELLSFLHNQRQVKTFEQIFSTLDPLYSGLLGVASGGTGATTLTGVVKASGTAPFTAGAVDLVTETTGLLPVSRLTGTLPEVNGGTGETDYADGELLIGNATGLSKATLTAGANISIINGPGSITINGPTGASGSFTTVDLKTVTVVNGIITSII